jgi:hypothetical protein
MEEKDEKIVEKLDAINKTLERILETMKKPENKIVRGMTIASLSASLLGAGLFGIIDFIIKTFFGG